MKRRDKITIARVLLVLLLTMYGGKAFHFHSEAYYSAQTTQSCEGNLKDDCVVCHFSVFPYLEAEAAACLFFAVPLLFIFFVPATRLVTVTFARRSLRAPPAGA